MNFGDNEATRQEIPHVGREPKWCTSCIEYTEDPIRVDELKGLDEIGEEHSPKPRFSCIGKTEEVLGIREVCLRLPEIITQCLGRVK